MANNLLDLGRERAMTLLQEAHLQGIDRAQLVRAIENLPPDQFRALQSGHSSGFAALNQAMGGRLDPTKHSSTLGGQRKPSSVWSGLTNPATLAFLSLPLGAAAAGGALGAGGAAAAGAARGGIGGSGIGIGDVVAGAAGVANAVGGAQSGAQADKYAEAMGEAGLRESQDREAMRQALFQRLMTQQPVQRPDLSQTFAGSQNPFGSVASRPNIAPISAMPPVGPLSAPSGPARPTPTPTAPLPPLAVPGTGSAATPVNDLATAVARHPNERAQRAASQLSRVAQFLAMGRSR